MSLATQESWSELPMAPLLPLFLIPFILLFLSTRRGAISKKSWLPPSPPKLPFIGNLHQLGSPLHRSLRRLSDKHGSLMLLHLGQAPVLVVSSPEAAQLIMRSHDLVFSSRPNSNAIRLLHGDTPDLAFAPYGDHWRQVRKISVTHLLSTKMVQSFRPVREEEVATMISKISKESMSMSSVDMSAVLNSFSSDVVSRIVSGKFDGVRRELLRELMAESKKLIGGLDVGECFPRLPWLDVFFGSAAARAKRNFERWDVALDQIIMEHADDHGSKRVGNGNGVDFLDVLLSHHYDSNKDFYLTKEHIKVLLMNFYGAGIDTSYIALEWSLAELTRNPAAMKKLQQEVRGVSKGKSEVTEEDLSQMSYLRSVLKEVLRLHPPAPLLLPRESMVDCRIEGYEIPKGTRVIVNAWAIGRDPKYWEAPDEFRPERFIDSPIDFRGNDFQFMPFGAGRRMCPGMNFAVATIEYALANLVHRFDWHLPENMGSEDLDMADNPGLTAGMKGTLHLVPKLVSTMIQKM